MKNFREKEEEKLKEQLVEKSLNLITVDKIDEIVKQKKMHTKISEEYYKQQLKEMENRVKNRDMLISN